MKTSRIHLLAVVSLLAWTSACHVDTPPALREALAQEAQVANRRVAAATVPGAVPAETATVSDERAEAGEASDERAASAASSPERTTSPRAARTPLADDGPTDDVPAGEPAASAMRTAATGSTTPPTGGDADLASASAPSRPASERFPRPRAVRGIYANAWAAGSSARMDELLGIARRTEVNALVVDIKDASGYVSHRTKVPLAHEIGATGEIRIRDLPGLLERLEREGVYPIARIVIVKDPILAQFRPELAVNDTAGGVWVDSKGFTWMNPYSRDLWDYHVALAREVALLGFPEIQYDYVRFPDAPQDDLARAVYLGADGRSKATVIREFLEYAREELADLDVQITADVFGVTT
ncbi:MAG TPA: putative glycoside hydrolase, partial [Longimicrobiales bacterium]|nr:putative glycoside hydrolase [Longimicrobiales bacterium]